MHRNMHACVHTHTHPSFKRVSKPECIQSRYSWLWKHKPRFHKGCFCFQTSMLLPSQPTIPALLGQGLPLGGPRLLSPLQPDKPTNDSFQLAPSRGAGCCSSTTPSAEMPSALTKWAGDPCCLQGDAWLQWVFGSK